MRYFTSEYLFGISTCYHFPWTPVTGRDTIGIQPLFIRFLLGVRYAPHLGESRGAPGVDVAVCTLALAVLSFFFSYPLDRSRATMHLISFDIILSFHRSSSGIVHVRRQRIPSASKNGCATRKFELQMRKNILLALSISVPSIFRLLFFVYCQYSSGINKLTDVIFVLCVGDYAFGAGGTRQLLNDVSVSCDIRVYCRLRKERAQLRSWTWESLAHDVVFW